MMQTTTPPNAQQPKSGWRRFKPLLIIVAVISFGWSGFWSYVRYQVEQAVETAMRDGPIEGLSFRCNSIDYGGFPFRLTAVCMDGEIASLIQNNERLSLAFDKVHIHATIFNPDHIVVDIKNKLTLSPSWSEPLHLTFDEMLLSLSQSEEHSDVRLSATGLKASSQGFALAPHAITIPIQSSLESLLVNLASRIETSAYPAPELADTPAMMINVSADAQGFKLTPQAPPLALEVAGRLNPFWPPFINSPKLAALAKTSLIVNKFDVVTEDQARAHANIDLHIGSDGFPDGHGQLVIVKPANLAKHLQHIHPQSTMLLLGLTLLGSQPTTFNGEDAVGLTFKLQNGTASIGKQTFNLPPSARLF